MGLCSAVTVSKQGIEAVFLLDKSHEKERRSGALWVTGKQSDQPTPCPDTAGPALSLHLPYCTSLSVIEQFWVLFSIS